MSAALELIQQNLRSGFEEYKKDFDKQRGHGIMMSFSWLVLGSVALVLPRYYKFLFQSKGFQTKKGSPVWRIIHTSLIVAIALITFGAFILVLESKDWKWSKAYPIEDPRVRALNDTFGNLTFAITSLTNPTSPQRISYVDKCDKLDAAYALRFTHSILGILTLSLTIIYPIFAFLRPKPEARAAKAFDAVFQMTGLGIYALALLAMVFGTIIFFNQSYATYVTGFRLEPLLLAGWAIWLLILLPSLELAQRSVDRSKHIIEGTPSLSVLEKTELLIKIGGNERLKFYILVLHIFMAIAFEIVLIVFIAVYVPGAPPILDYTDTTNFPCIPSQSFLNTNFSTGG